MDRTLEVVINCIITLLKEKSLMNKWLIVHNYATLILDIFICDKHVLIYIITAISIA